MSWLVLCALIFPFSLQAFAIPLIDFYPYGGDQGDQLLYPNDDDSTPPINLTVSFPFFGRDYETIFVNNNGVISFTIPVSAFTPAPFPLGNGLELIAPYWADVDTTGTGQVWYRETSNPELLNRVQREIVRVFFAHQNFAPINLFIATWDHVGYFSSHTDKTNTFQCIMTTDGQNSFVIFLYADNGIEWTTGDASGGVDGLGGTPAHVGFNAGDGNRSATVPASRTADIINIETTSNVGVPGMWVLQVDEEELEFGGCLICSVKLTPHYGNQLGGAPLLVSINNVTFQEEDDITCVFGDQELKGVYISKEQVLCVSPELPQTGIVLFQLLITHDGRTTFRGEANYNSLPFQRAFEALVESEEPVFESGGLIKVYWSPQSIFPLIEDHRSYTVDITLRELDMITSEWRIVATLASNLDNNGEVDLIIPDLPIVENYEDSVNPVVVEVGVSSASLTSTTTKRGILNKIGRFGLRILKQTPMRIAKKLIIQATQRLACETWALTQDDNIGEQINNRLERCPCTADRARLNNHFKEEKLSSIVMVIGQVQNYLDTTIFDDAFRNYFHPGAASCFRQRVDTSSVRSLTGGSGQQCCYNNTGHIITGPPGGGTVDIVSPDVSLKEHFFKDVLPFWLCCKAGVFSNCGRYYESRPSDDCSPPDPPPPPARASGDPHLVTLDGYKYTFNGRGEFTLIQAANDSFTLQGRMVSISSQNGGTPLATVFSALVARQIDSDTVQFEISNGDGIVTLVNGEQVDFNVIEQQFKNVTVTDLGNNTLSAVFSSGVYLEAQQEHNILSSVLVTLPESYMEIKTQGLLGTFNGDTSDDLKPKSVGKTIPLNSTLQEIHVLFGLSWIIDTPRESLFTYPPDQSWSTYYYPFFEPVYQPVFQDAILEMEANRLCEDDIFCLFDIAATGNTELGLSTLHTSQEIAELERLSLPIVCDPPCENGACVANDTCACSEGFIGKTCAEIVLMECEENPCENGGTCTRHVNDYICTCPPEFTGYLCEVENPKTENDKTTTIAIVVGTTVTFLCLVVIIILAVFFYKAKRKKESVKTKKEAN